TFTAPASSTSKSCLYDTRLPLRAGCGLHRQRHVPGTSWPESPFLPWNAIQLAPRKFPDGVVEKLDAAMRTLHLHLIGWLQLAAQGTLVSVRRDQAPVHLLVGKNAKNTQRSRNRRGIILFLIRALHGGRQKDRKSVV